MKPVYDLLTLGEILLRFSPSGSERISVGQTMIKMTGGAELNVAAGAAELGLRTGILSRIPENELGAFARNQVRSCGVSDRYLVTDDSPAGRMGLYFYEGASSPRKPRVVYDRRNSSASEMDIEDFPEEIYANTRCFHTSGITLAISGKARACAVEMIRRFKQAGALISFDVNFRGNLWSGDEARECILQILPYVDWFFCSEDTARLTFLKEGDLYSIMKSFTKEYPIRLVASTQRTVHSPRLHSFGSVIYSAEKERFYTEEPYRNIEVTDRIGSGDAYVAGVLYGLLSDPGNISGAMAYGNAAAAHKNTVPGDLPAFSREELDTIIREHNSSGRKTEMNR